MPTQLKVRAIIVRDGKLLGVQNKSSAMSGSWCLPGGGLEEGEALIDGLKREIYEETGVSVKIGKLLYIQQFKHDDNDFLEFFFLVENADDFLNVDLSKTTHGLAEIEMIEFVDPSAVKFLPEFLAKENLDEMKNGKSPKIFSYL